jgi:hypothetical protein
MDAVLQPAFNLTASLLPLPRIALDLDAKPAKAKGAPACLLCLRGANQACSDDSQARSLRQTVGRKPKKLNIIAKTVDRMYFILKLEPLYSSK